MKCLVTETLSGRKDGAEAVIAVALQTTEENVLRDTRILRIDQYRGFRVFTGSL